MGRRAPRDRFMPDVWVFPGGRVERGDARASAASELRPGVARRLAAHTRPELGRGLAVAALRETWEETGVALGRPDAATGSLVPELGRIDYVARAITPTTSPIRYHARFFVARSEDATGRLQSGPELVELRWVRLGEALRLPAIDVTRAVLREVEAWTSGRRRAGTPLVHYRSGRMHVRRS